jgi:formamidopyrimidine-DNA glycosylase
MPELPEVETLRQELEKAVVGRKIARVEVRQPKIIRAPSPEEFRKRLTGTTVEGILRKAKVLIIRLSNGSSLVVHLKMTGQLVYPGSGKDARVSFFFADGTVLDFNDQRLFAELRVMKDWKALPFIQSLGPEPFELNAEEFGAMLASKKTKIKPLLMNQAFISGIGNLYAAEALFKARINPSRSAQGLTDSEKNSLFQAIKEVLSNAIKEGGSSVDNYVRLSGKPGGYAAYHAVYGREGKPCVSCKAPVKRIALGGRGTYFCSHCQK